MSEATEATEASVSEQLFQRLDLPAPLPHDVGAGMGQVTELTDGWRWDEGAMDETMGPDRNQPRDVGHVGLATGQVLHVTSVDQHHLEALSI
jgi:hypothetical protein